MRASEIRVGATYVNKNKGPTRRTVFAIGPDCRIGWLGNDPQPGEQCVRFFDGLIHHSMRLASFASWSGSEVSVEDFVD